MSSDKPPAPIVEAETFESTPSTSDPRMTDMITSTRRALRPSGGRKVATPFEMASRPVSEEPPLANDLRTTNKVAP